MYWDIYKTLSYNCLFNFIIGNRGGGKTFGFKKYAIDDFLKNGNQFVYVRRFSDELKANSKFFNDIKQFYPDIKFEVKNKVYYINDEVAGQAMTLSTAKIQKSVPFPTVSKICFDEFILDKGVYHYLPDEVIAFLELYETIARMRDVKVFFLSNALTVTNPYFLYFDLSLPYGKDIRAKDDVLLQLVQDEEFIKKKKQTRFAKIIEGTSYSEYAIDNTFLRDSNNFVAKKTAESYYLFTMIYNGVKLGVWNDYKNGAMFVSENVDPYCKSVYSITKDDHSPNTMLLKSAKRLPLFKYFLDNFNLGCVRFENVNIKNLCYQIIKLAM